MTNEERQAEISRIAQALAAFPGSAGELGPILGKAITDLAAMKDWKGTEMQQVALGAIGWIGATVYTLTQNQGSTPALARSMGEMAINDIAINAQAIYRAWLKAERT